MSIPDSPGGVARTVIETEEASSYQYVANPSFGWGFLLGLKLMLDSLCHCAMVSSTNQYQEATPMTNTIKVEIKSVYGTQKIYPACPKAETFCKMIGQKTLTDIDIKRIKELGFEVQVASTLPQTL